MDYQANAIFAEVQKMFTGTKTKEPVKHRLFATHASKAVDQMAKENGEKANESDEGIKQVGGNQSEITDADLTSQDHQPVYVAISIYADHPHASVEGSFADRQKAKELLQKCRSHTEQPHPTAWSLWRFQIGEEPECLSP